MQDGLKEIWKDIPGHEDYRVSSKGRVWSKTRWRSPANGRRYLRPGRLLKENSNNGYRRVRLFSRKKYSDIHIHRLVWLAFMGPIPEDKEINHKNGVKHDNQLGNLEVVTSSENRLHAIRTGLVHITRGEDRSKLLTNDNVIEMRRLYDIGWTQKELMHEFKIKAVDSILTGKSWTHLPAGKEKPTKRGFHSRHAQGVKINTAKLNENDVLEIRRLASTVRQSELARRYGVTQVNISAIVRGETWKHVK